MPALLWRVSVYIPPSGLSWLVYGLRNIVAPVKLNIDPKYGKIIRSFHLLKTLHFTRSIRYTACVGSVCGGGRVRGEHGMKITVGCGVRDVPISSCGIRHTATPHSAATAGSSNDFSRLATLCVCEKKRLLYTAQDGGGSRLVIV
jgi:hypothetical protein